MRPASGAQVIAIALPFYLTLSQADTLRFGREVAERAALPAYLYNVPHSNLAQFPLGALKQLSTHDHILGLTRQLRRVRKPGQGGPDRLSQKPVRPNRRTGRCTTFSESRRPGADLLHAPARPHSGMLDRVLREHAAIAEALQNNNPQEVRTRLAAHIQNSTRERLEKSGARERSHLVGRSTSPELPDEPHVLF